jgi:hypothetical protein
MEVYVYGTGCGAGELCDTVLPPRRVAAFVETCPAAETFLGRPVISAEELSGRAYDLILVASRQAGEIARHCAALGIDGERVVYLKNNLLLRDRNRSYARAEELLGAPFLRRLRQSQRVIRTPLWSEEERLPEAALENDYVRVKTLEALCRRLEVVPGAAAELGVFQGGFARCINALLPERTLYLFDTFSGFDPAEAAGTGAGFAAAHRNTAADRVLAGLPVPGRAVLRQGRFPDSARGLEERFALVSLDVDLEESTYAGLCWFLPRMNPGGYLLLHDYSAPDLPGVRAALERWERERGTRLHGVPLCDVNGTLVLSL